MATVQDFLQYQMVVGPDAIRTKVVLRSTARDRDEQIQAALYQRAFAATPFGRNGC